MKLYAPEYYRQFQCIADKCTHSCCIGWEIDVDEEALSLYEKMEGGFGDEIRKSICYDENPHFALCVGDRCPHLEIGGLCKIIKTVGEEYLCSICREHPRFYNYTSLGKEVGLGMACEEAARIILSSNGFGNLVEIGVTEGETEEACFEAVEQRKVIFETLSNGKLSYSQKIKLIEERYNVTPSSFSDEEWREVILSLEYLNEEHKSLFLNYSSTASVDKALEGYLLRALAYFVYRHCSEACDGEEFSSALGFSLFCEKLLASVLSSHLVSDLKDVVKMARIISEELEYSVDNTDFIKSKFEVE